MKLHYRSGMGVFFSCLTNEKKTQATTTSFKGNSNQNNEVALAIVNTVCCRLLNIYRLLPPWAEGITTAIETVISAGCSSSGGKLHPKRKQNGRAVGSTTVCCYRHCVTCRVNCSRRPKVQLYASHDDCSLVFSS
mgnify:CR=1 FL=1